MYCMHYSECILVIVLYDICFFFYMTFIHKHNRLGPLQQQKNPSVLFCNAVICCFCIFVFSLNCHALLAICPFCAVQSYGPVLVFNEKQAPNLLFSDLTHRQQLRKGFTERMSRQHVFFGSSQRLSKWGYPWAWLKSKCTVYGGLTFSIPIHGAKCSLLW